MSTSAWTWGPGDTHVHADVNIAHEIAAQGDFVETPAVAEGRQNAYIPRRVFIRQSSDPARCPR